MPGSDFVAIKASATLSASPQALFEVLTPGDIDIVRQVCVGAGKLHSLLTFGVRTEFCEMYVLNFGNEAYLAAKSSCAYPHCVRGSSCV